MTFWGEKFVFDGVVSDSYGLLCGKTNGSGEDSSSFGSSVEIIEDYVLKRSKPYFYGIKFSEKLEFSIDFFSETPIDRFLVQAIEQWLFGHRDYKKLQILQCDLYDTYFNCLLTKGDVIAVGNEVIGFSCTVTCDAPWGWGRMITSKVPTIDDDKTVEIINTSDDNLYLYPILNLYSPKQQTDVRIINLSDNNREVYFSSLNSGETIRIDNDIKLVTSDKEGIYDRFNGVYFRLLRGKNLVRFVGNLFNTSIEYIPARKVGS